MKNSILLLTLFLCFFSVSVDAQYVSLSESSEVSILTIGPGAQLYDKFGHSAFRIQDSVQGIDVVYNYGVYDFETPNFYTKFAQGKLLYKLVVNSYAPFSESYIRQNRWIKEQILDLSDTEKQEIFNFLQNNAKPENMFYKYDFFYDNCATKIRDVLVTVLGDDLVYQNKIAPEGKTFRELIQQNVYSNSWGSLGMDVAIGAVVDKKATAWEYQFLPDYVFEGAAHATLNNAPLIKETVVLHNNIPKEEKRNFFSSPLYVFGLLSVLILWVTWKDFRTKDRSRYLDSILFFVTGLIGVFLLLLWTATDHTATANNYNMLWAFPLNLFLIWAIGKSKPKRWLARYVFFLILLFGLLGIHWITGVQVFAAGFIPLFIVLILRYLYVFYFLKKQNALSEVVQPITGHDKK
jgi:hypothetical protein